MQREIKYKMTILHTAEDHIGIKNKFGCPGIKEYYKTGKYLVEAFIGKRRFRVGLFDSLEEAIEVKHIADAKKQEGILQEWLATKPYKTGVRKKRRDLLSP